jgi:hypothetical protein
MGVVIRIVDHVKAASTYEDGEIIHRIIEREMHAGRPITIDFTGVLSVPSAFVNSAFVRLLEQFDFEQVKSHVTFIGSTKQINQLIKSRFAFVLRQARQ